VADLSGRESREAVRRFRVDGRVQGVGFRAWMVRTGEALGLRGWVRNCVDGSVEAALAGPPRALQRMEALLGVGPRNARVSGVESVELDGEGLPLGGIEVLR
jgi:acylphosphatase